MFDGEELKGDIPSLKGKQTTIFLGPYIVQIIPNYIKLCQIISNYINLCLNHNELSLCSP